MIGIKRAFELCPENGGHIFFKNHKDLGIKVQSMCSKLDVSIHADHNGANIEFVSHS